MYFWFAASLDNFEDQPYGIDVFEDKLYVTTLKNNQLLIIDKFGLNNSRNDHDVKPQVAYLV